MKLKLLAGSLPAGWDEHVTTCIAAAAELGRADALRWIPVGERLPSPDPKASWSSEPVLVLRKRALRVAARLHADDGRWYSVPGYYHLADVTHWMPLPPLPEIERSES
jgi:hypothetical protein